MVNSVALCCLFWPYYRRRCHRPPPHPYTSIICCSPQLARLTCSAKKCDNLLVEADIFYHFRGIIFCNAKHLQFHRYFKNKNIVAQFSKSSIQLCRPFFIWWGCWFRSRRTKKFIIATAPLSFFMVAE